MATTSLAGLILMFAAVTCGDEGVTRQLTVVREWETSCVDQLHDNDTCSLHPLAHVVATSAQDTLHVLISLWDAPSCLLLRTPPSAQLSLDWTRLLSGDPTGAVRADGVTAAYGLSLDRLIEFDDPADSADLGAANATVLQPLRLDLTPAGRSLEVTSSAGEDGEQTVLVALTAPPQNSSDWAAVGAVTVQVAVLNTERRTEELPHLQQTGDSVVAGVVLSKLHTDSGFQHSRFGLQMTAVGNQTQQLRQTKSLDDEYTPGVFKLLSLSSAAPSGGFLQWRPVAYTDPEYTIEHSTSARDYSLPPASASAPDSPLLRAYFGGQPSISQELNVTFGLSEDGWYADTEYAAWELTAGLGAPPSDQFSVMVILLLGIGLGLPTVALIGGGVWILVRRVRGQGAAGVSLLTEADQ